VNSDKPTALCAMLQLQWIWNVIKHLNKTNAIEIALDNYRIIVQIEHIPKKVPFKRLVQ